MAVVSTVVFECRSFVKSADNDINRVFTIYFPDKETSKIVFPDLEYLKVKRACFENAVLATTTHAEYEK